MLFGPDQQMVDDSHVLTNHIPKHKQKYQPSQQQVNRKTNDDSLNYETKELKDDGDANE